MIYIHINIPTEPDMDNLLIKNDNTKTLCDKIKKYIGDIQFFDGISGINTLLKKIEINFTKTKININVGEITPSYIFQTYNIVGENIYIFEQIVETLENISIKHQKQFVMNVTDKKLSQINDTYLNILTIYTKYKTKSFDNITKYNI